MNATDGDDQIIQEPDRVTINAVQMVVLSDVEKTLVDGGLGADQTTMTGEFILDDSSDFKVDLNGPALALYDHVSVIGAVDLNNATLSLNLGYKPTTGDTFVIIDNQDAPVSGTFSDLPEGAEFYVDGTKFSITYFGGVDSNDVILVDALDFGDAPSPYPTTLAEDGARHDTSAGPTLGLNRDSEADGTHSATASGDDTTGTPDDEDGVTFGTISVGQIGASITVNVQGGTGKLDAWIDFNGDGSWYSVGEQIADSLTVSAGDNTITFNVPAEAIDGNVYGRFRLSTAGGLAPTGAAPDGEVEDYQLAISPPSGSGQLVDNGQTLTSQNTVREVLEIAKE
ncbi:MAG: hypothetical protein H8E28_02090 [Anaerolineae bacterium]|nr:hypothetical protein [Anaerolineae bacterium]